MTNDQLIHNYKQLGYSVFETLKSKGITIMTRKYSGGKIIRQKIKNGVTISTKSI